MSSAAGPGGAAPAQRSGVGLGLVALSAVCFGTLGVFGKLAQRQGIAIPTLLGLRFGIAALLLVALGGLRRRRRPSRRGLASVALMGLLYTAQASCFFISLRTVPAAVTSILLYTYPVVVTLFSRLLLGEALGPARVVVLAIASTGTLFVVDPFAASHLDLAGVLWGLGCAVVYSAYILCGAVLLRGVDPVAATTGISAVAGACFLVAAAIGGTLSEPGPAGVGVVVGIAVVATLVAATAFLVGLARVGPSRASILSTLEPATTAVLAAVLLGEGLGAVRWTGAALVVTAAALLQRRTAPTIRE